jgi:hypothetical protein
MPEQEEWRPIPGWPDYQASSHGRLVSLKWGKRREIAPWPNKFGYLGVSLHGPGGRRLSRTVHRIIAETFIGPLPEGMETRHLDGNKLNNSVSNLTYGSRSENAIDQVVHGVHNQASKTRCRSGHPYNEANTRHLADGSRECRICRRETKRRFRIRQALRAANVSGRAA